MILTTERLILRDFVEEDWEAVYAYQSDLRYLRYYRWTGRSPDEVLRFVQGFIFQQRAQLRNVFQLAIIVKDEQRLIGNCGIRKQSSDAWEAELGYEIAPEDWGKGYATEAARAMVTFGFKELRLHRIKAECIAENLASARVLEKIGMRREGHLRENEWMKGRWWDTYLYGILEQEWHAQRA